MSEARVLEYIEEHRDEMISFLRRLVRIDTQTPPGLNYDVISDVVADKLFDLGCDVCIHEAPEKYMELSGAKFMGLEGPRSNVVARYPGKTGKPVLHISAHIDTAAIQEEGWTVDPLGGEITEDCPYGRSDSDRGGGYIWGRGVADDKGELVSMIYALQAVHELGIKLDGDLILTANCDEEIGGVAGLGFLMQEGIVKADYGVQWDGGLTGIGLAAQGRTRFLVRTRGVSHHGQVPILGVNAIEKMSKINVALTDYWREVLLKRQKEVPGIELGSALKERGITKMTAMLNIGTIKGGVQGATVPDLCEEEVLRGMIPGETFDDVREEFVGVIEAVKAGDPDLVYEVEVINSREGYVVSPEDLYVREARDIVREVTGRTLPFTGTLASTDMNYQVNEGGMPCFNLGVGGPYSNGHKQDESASIDEIVDCAKIAALIYMRKLKTSD
ncbi:M20/M25/M40 family metallo-hydrolase [Candidatus Bathyarchaeota archaeon]|nr:M20/M25/M40 family metallo-hydrolase [Candidatus Bathyarchaeota archaeon]